MLPLRVLVLEDHLFQRSVAVSMLRQLGCQEVLEAADGAEALAVLRESGAVDIVLCDLRMEGMDGLEFLRQVGVSGLVRSVIISSSLPDDLRRVAGQMVSLLGLDLLGDICKPLGREVLEKLLKKSIIESVVQPMRSLSLLELESEEEVFRGLAEHEFRAYFQPKFDLLTGEVRGVEVLARWHHPVKGILPPSTFLPVIERCNLWDEMLFEQLDQGLSVQEQLLSQGHPLNLAFNLDTSQLANCHLTARIKAVLRTRRASGSGLTFELTETGLLEAPVTSLENLLRLRMMGCGLSLDDFGAGFSSLQRLCQLPFSEIKLDGEFIRNLKLQPRCGAVISSTLAMAKSLGMSVVIEGIETSEQLSQLQEMGCTLGQGYLYARPMCATDFMTWMSTTYPTKRRTSHQLSQ